MSALAKCTTCGREISVEAKACPGCGQPQKRPKKRRGVLNFLLGLAALPAFAAVLYVVFRIFAGDTAGQDRRREFAKAASTGLTFFEARGVGGVNLVVISRDCKAMQLPGWARTIGHGFSDDGGRGVLDLGFTAIQCDGGKPLDIACVIQQRASVDRMVDAPDDVTSAFVEKACAIR